MTRISSAIKTLTCVQCGCQFEAPFAQRRLCSDACWKVRNNARNAVLRRENKDRYAKRHLVRYSENPERFRGYHYKHRYGVTTDEVAAMHAAQSGGCAICRAPIALTGTKRTELAAVDHCHASGAVRGLLCRNCNLLLGNAKDSPETLRAALAYLGRAT